MSCNSCDSCTNTSPAIPECFTGFIEIGSIADAGYTVTVEIWKRSNNARVSGTYVSSGSGLITIKLTDFAEVDPSFFSRNGGQYTLTVYDSGREALPMFDGADTTAPDCILLNFIAGEGDPEGTITLVYDV